jgi:putative membrane protein
VRALGPRLAPTGESAATRRQKGAFFLGLAALWIGSDWPMHELSEGFLYSAHMIQHMLFTFVAPPLLLLGAPKWMVRALLSPPRLMTAVQVLSKPLIALLLFNGLVAFTHWAALVNASLRSEPLHFAVHAALFGAALLMWTPVVGPLPELSRLSDPAKLLYLFGQSILPTVPASFLTFAQRPIYSFYETVPRLWGLPVLTDQLIAGLIMKIGGGLLLWSIMAVVFFRWHARELSDKPDEVTWDDFEIELSALGLRK